MPTCRAFANASLQASSSDHVGRGGVESNPCHCRLEVWLLQTQVSLRGFSQPGDLGFAGHAFFALSVARVTGTIVLLFC